MSPILGKHNAAAIDYIPPNNQPNWLMFDHVNQQKVISLVIDQIVSPAGER